MDYAQNGLPVYIKDYAIMPNEKYKIIFHVCNKNIIYDWVPDVRKVFAEIIITKTSIRFQNPKQQQFHQDDSFL